MNLPSNASTASDQSQNGALRAQNTTSTPKTATSTDQSSHILNTSVAMTITPATAAVSAGSSLARGSPANQLHLKTHTMARQDSMENGVSPRTYPSPSPSSTASAKPDRYWSERSPSPHNRMIPQGAMTEAIAASKSPGLIRRLSRGAHNRLRRRASHQHSMRMRDQSAGPILVRTRSDSNAASDIAQDVSDLELDNGTDELDDQSNPPSIRDRNNPLGIIVGRTSNASSNFDGGLAAAMASAALQAGTWVTKHSNKSKRKRIKIWLDPSSARVCWHPTNFSKSFFIDDVREVRVGAESRYARDDAQIPDRYENRWMTIVYQPPERSKGRTIKTMHLIMDSEVVLLYWNEALSTVARERSEIMNALSTSTEKSERGMAMGWRQVMTRKGSNAEEVFTLDDARWLCKKLEINCSDNAVVTHYKSCDPSKSERLDYPAYKDFVDSFKGRKDIQNVFRNVNMGTDLDIELSDFLSFLRTDQHIDVEKDRAYWEGVFDRFAKPAQNRPSLPDAGKDLSQKTLSLKNFQNFLTSGFNAPLAPSKAEVTLDRPLNEYFISSSHNTYLLGRQVAGASSVEGYIQALIRGCRCIEIDCWDGENGRPMVTHGRTMTSKVSFEDCVSTIGKYAFHSSPYPLIVSLEVHCNPEQQKAMVDIMMRYWKNVIVTEPLVTNAVSLPSPEELKGRILVKVKAADEEVEHQLPIESNTGRSRARSLGSAFNRTPSVDRYGVTSTPMISSPPASSPFDLTNGRALTPRGSVTTGSPSSSASDSDDMTSEKPRKRKTSKIASELGNLGVYAQGIKYNGFTAAEARTTNHIFSFNENTFGKLCTKENDSRTSLERHNLRYLMRVYPAARRIDSSNFNPLQAWRRGAQMAALNWQTYDVHQQVNEAMFAAGSDRLGYVLKPEELRHAKHLPIADTIPEAPGKKAKKGKKIVKFRVDIRSAQRLPRPRNQPPDAPMNPFIEFEMYSAEDKALGVAKGEGGIDVSTPNGVSGIGLPVRKRSKIVEGNGFDPIYHDSITMTVETKYPSLIFVRFTVWSSPDPHSYSSNSSLLATFTAKLSSLQQGYRHLPLFNPHGEQYREAKLFVNIKKEAPVPVESADNAYGIMETSASPRPEPVRQERSWRSRVFSRNSSQRRTSNYPNDDVAGVISRTSSMDRENL